MLAANGDDRKSISLPEFRNVACPECSAITDTKKVPGSQFKCWRCSHLITVPALCNAITKKTGQPCKTLAEPDSDRCAYHPRTVFYPNDSPQPLTDIIAQANRHGC